MEQARRASWAISERRVRLMWPPRTPRSAYRGATPSRTWMNVPLRIPIIRRWTAQVARNRVHGVLFALNMRYSQGSSDRGEQGWSANARVVERERVLRGWTRRDLALAACVGPKTLNEFIG